jgi:hypothetical protein
VGIKQGTIPEYTHPKWCAHSSGGVVEGGEGGEDDKGCKRCEDGEGSKGREGVVRYVEAESVAMAVMAAMAPVAGMVVEVAAKEVKAVQLKAIKPRQDSGERWSPQSSSQPLSNSDSQHYLLVLFASSKFIKGGEGGADGRIGEGNVGGNNRLYPSAKMLTAGKLDTVL